MFQCMLLPHPDLQTRWQGMRHMSLTEEHSECTHPSQKGRRESAAHALTCVIKTCYRNSITSITSLQKHSEVAVQLAVIKCSHNDLYLHLHLAQFLTELWQSVRKLQQFNIFQIQKSQRGREKTITNIIFHFQNFKCLLCSKNLLNTSYKNTK
jgi:hypothetical protein